jgi:hypothetical protein
MQYQIAQGTDIVVSIMRLVIISDNLRRLVDVTRAAQLLKEHYSSAMSVEQIAADIREMRDKRAQGPTVLGDCVIQMGRRHGLSDA